MTVTQFIPSTSPNAQLIQKGNGLQVVVGLGASGLAAINYLAKNGYQVAVTDESDPLVLKERLKDELPNTVTTYFGGIDEELLAIASRIVISPGIDPFLPVFEKARAKNIPIVSDIQIFHEVCQSRNIPIVAITGSNAKSTVTTLVGEMAQNASQYKSKKVGVGGNLGTPALDLFSDDLALAILELSSFQLQTTSHLNAQVATVLNMSPDHLDRHGDMLGYHQAKHRIFQGAKSIVINRDDPLSRPLVADNTPVISFGSNAPDMHQYGLITEGNGDIWLARGRERLLHESEVQIKGQHNLMNALSALAIGELTGLPLDEMLVTLKHFAGLPHRCQFITTKLLDNGHGLDCFDDSKGTNIGSTIAAILGLGKVYQPKGKKLAVILGGQGKGQDFSPLAHPLLTYAKKIYLIGEDSEKIRQNLAIMGIGSTEENDDTQTIMMNCGTLENAVNQAWQDAKHNADLGVLLLSPACASFDQFTGYGQRGQKFVELVNAE